MNSLNVLRWMCTLLCANKCRNNCLPSVSIAWRTFSRHKQARVSSLCAVIAAVLQPTGRVTKKFLLQSLRFSLLSGLV